MKIIKEIISILLLFVFSGLALQAQPKAKEFSTAGFFLLPGTDRTVENLNPAWRFTKDKDGSLNKVAYREDYNDSQWGVVSLPNGLEYLPEEASGGINYRGEAWYRKHFVLDQNHQGKRLMLYFEAIMGKSKIWVNGELAAEHFGGYLPVPIDITDLARPGKENLIAVWTDNADDPAYPPGKPQATLDFAYFGGIYRDCWLISTNKVYITDANQTDLVAGGGLYVTYSEVTDKKATISLNLHLQNDLSAGAKGEIRYELTDKNGRKVASASQKYQMAAKTNHAFKNQMSVTDPQLWSPDNPFLYHLNITVTGANGKTLDGYTKRIGIRTFRFTPDEGFILNGKPYPRKLIGGNRHQDYAVVGNALSNSLHWRDAYKLKKAGMDIIRNAHYPQDPAFMDACEELGLFVIVNTPGWQFWNDAPIFQDRVFKDIRNMVRRDRNSPTVVMWEPILNETHYPADFAERVHNIIKEELPNQESYTAADLSANGSEHFDIIFSHPMKKDLATGKNGDPTKVYFTREWGDNVDDWSSHNSPSRVSRRWGEVPMLIQMNHYAKPYYSYISYDDLYSTGINHVGGTLWHPFDHQRGYHPDPFYGGIMDAFRRPKYSYEMFKAQSDQVAPMVYIANEMTPFSPRDVSVVSNCDEVRLYTQTGDSFRVYKRAANNRFSEGIPSPVIVFKEAWDVMKDKDLSRQRKQEASYLKAEGLINGKVVATDIRNPSRRPSELKLIADTEGINPVANGGDLFTVVAQMTDHKGVVKRLNNSFIKFEIEGEGRLVGNEEVFSNPKQIVWGEAPILIQTTTRAGKIKIKASATFPGDHAATSTVLEVQSIAPSTPLLFSENENKLVGQSDAMAFDVRTITDAQKKKTDRAIKEVEYQQEFFEGDVKKD